MPSLIVICFFLFRGSEFERNFDSNISNYPLAASIAKQDPNLRKIMLRESEAAYNKGGWRAANAALDVVLSANLEVNADDEHVLATSRATLVVLNRLKGNPSACKAFLLTGSRGDDFPSAGREMDELAATIRAAEENGFNRKKTGVNWIKPGDKEMLDNYRSVDLGPERLSAAELDALAKDADGDDELYFSAWIKRLKNLLSRCRSEAAYIERQRMSLTSWPDWMKAMLDVCRRSNVESSGLVCSQSISMNPQRQVDASGSRRR